MPESSLTSTWTASTFKVSDSLSLFLSHMNKFCVCLILWVILGVWGWGWYMMVQNANRVRPIWIFMLNFSVIWLILNFWQIPSMPIWFFFDIKWCPLLERMRTLAYTLHGSDFWAEFDGEKMFLSNWILISLQIEMLYLFKTFSWCFHLEDQAVLLFNSWYKRVYMESRTWYGTQN